MILLNVGNLWDNEYLDAVIDWNKQFSDTVRVESLFGSISGLTPTARSSDRIPSRNPAFVIEYVMRAQDAGINIRYTLNHSCIGSTQYFEHFWFNELQDTLKGLHSIGIHQWTITSPLLVELVRNLFPNDFIEVSTIAEISTIEDIKRWEALGASGVNVSTSINRDFTALERLVPVGLPITLLANEACLHNCPWRRECYNLSSHDSLRSEQLFGFYPFRRCQNARLENPVEWLKARLILPQWMQFYKDRTRIMNFKIAYRTHPIEVALPMLRSYMEQQFTGNLLDMWPTISHLGSTVEPKDITNISCKRLDELGFIEHFALPRAPCSQHECGVTCKYCESIYSQSKVK